MKNGDPGDIGYDDTEFGGLDPRLVTTGSIDVSSLIDELESTGSVAFFGVETTSFGKLLQALPIPALLVDRYGNVIFLNRAWEKFSSDYKAILSSPFSLLFPNPNVCKEAARLIEKIFVTRKPTCTAAVLEIGRNKIFGRMHFRALRMAEERSVLVLVEDLTAEKKQLVMTRKHKEDLLKAHNGLERRVEERTVELKQMNEKLLLEIAERRKAEQASSASEDKYRIVVENAQEGICVCQDGKFRFVNRSGERLLGFTVKELVARSCADFVHPDDREVFIRYSEKTTEGEKAPSAYTCKFVDRAGNVKWVEINSVVIIWEGKPATLQFFTDVTSKLQWEEEQVKIAKLESLGTLAGGIAHDFNNMLTAIAGNIGLAKMRSVSQEKALERLTEAEKACERAQGLTKQLLTFSKGGEPIKKPADIAQITKDACLFASGGSNVRCDYSFSPDLRAVEVDEGQITQVINNIVINAGHAMPDGGVIGVSAENVFITPDMSIPLEPGNYVKLSFNDHGTGIPEAIIPKIFDPYFTTKQKGSGLGLATSYAIIQKHGGLITAESKVGEGSTFYIYLPASEKTVDEDLRMEDHLVKGWGKILVMDDDESIRHLAGEMLGTLGYQVTLAKDGEETLALVEQAVSKAEPFDCIVMDLTVPGGMGGLQTMQMLQEKYPGTKAIVSSGFSTDPVMADYQTYGFQGVCTKPYSIKELSEIVRKVIAVTDK